MLVPEFTAAEFLYAKRATWPLTRLRDLALQPSWNSTCLGTLEGLQALQACAMLQVGCSWFLFHKQPLRCKCSAGCSFAVSCHARPSKIDR